ncbi:MAG: hypothetical protein ACE5IK_03525 [Acidobacteriota bacterium]
MKRTLSVLPAALAVMACGPAADRTTPAIAEAATGPAAPEVTTLPPSVAALAIKNVRVPAPGLLTAGQLTESQLAALEQLGYRHFVSLREAGENGAGWEEAYAAEHGIDFVRLPVAGAAGVTSEHARELADTLEKAGDEPVVLYCGSSNRVGALLALKAHEIDGKDAPEALNFGLSAGLTRLEPVVRRKLGLSDVEAEESTD